MVLAGIEPWIPACAGTTAVAERGRAPTDKIEN